MKRVITEGPIRPISTKSNTARDEVEIELEAPLGMASCADAATSAMITGGSVGDLVRGAAGI
jgi:hypothetical protein